MIAVDLTLTGAGAPTTIIDATGAGTRVIITNPATTVLITGVTITGGNVSCTCVGCSAQGGGLANRGTLTVTNSTVSGNTASCGFAFGLSQGGGLFNNVTLTLTNVTVSGNTASCGAGSCSAFGGGLFNDNGAPTLMTATIVAQQLAGADCAGTITSNGFNLDSDNTCNLTQVTDKPGITSPGVGPLQNNGGPTQTHALLPGSPAIDMVLSGCPPPATDQRGVGRPQGTACDIGAYELDRTPIPTLSEWAQLGMVALLLGGGLLALRRRVHPA